MNKQLLLTLIGHGITTNELIHAYANRTMQNPKTIKRDVVELLLRMSNVKKVNGQWYSPIKHQIRKTQGGWYERRTDTHNQ